MGRPEGTATTVTKNTPATLRCKCSFSGRAAQETAELGTGTKRPVPEKGGDTGGAVGKDTSRNEKKGLGGPAKGLKPLDAERLKKHWVGEGVREGKCFKTPQKDENPSDEGGGEVGR